MLDIIVAIDNLLAMADKITLVRGAQHDRSSWRISADTLQWLRCPLVDGNDGTRRNPSKRRHRAEMLYEPGNPHAHRYAPELPLGLEAAATDLRALIWTRAHRHHVLILRISARELGHSTRGRAVAVQGGPSQAFAGSSNDRLPVIAQPATGD